MRKYRETIGMRKFPHFVGFHSTSTKLKLNSLLYVRLCDVKKAIKVRKKYTPKKKHEHKSEFNGKFSLSS
jgi:hypothetical protein